MFRLSGIDLGSLPLEKTRSNSTRTLNYSNIYTGYADNEGNGSKRYVFQAFNDTWIWTEDLFPTLIVNGISLKPKLGLINGCLYWEGSGYYAYNTIANIDNRTTDFICFNKYPGYIPVVWEYDEYEWDSEDDRFIRRTYKAGDVYYQIGRLPGFNETKTGKRTGAVVNDTDIDVTLSWKYWSKPGANFYPYGIYTPATGSGATGNRILGCPRWKKSDNSSVIWIKSISQQSGHYVYVAHHVINGNFRPGNIYGDIVYNSVAGKWIIGLYNDPNGWWESNTAPIEGENSTITFSFNAPSGSEATGSDITVNFLDYQGYEMQETIIGEVCKWR